MRDIKIVKDSITRDEISKIAEDGFGDFVKVVVDIKQGIMAVGGELHADAEVALVEQCGSKRENIWGINIYPEKSGEEYLEFDSMINIKPAYGNRSRSVEDHATQELIRALIKIRII
jgi:hypothetical protein